MDIGGTYDNATLSRGSSIENLNLM